MTLCPCGCRRPARTKAGYAGRGCYLRSIPPEVRGARTRAWAKANPEKFREFGRKGQQTRRKTVWDDLIDRWLDDDVRPEDALRAAYNLGYHGGYLAGQKNILRRQRAA